MFFGRHKNVVSRVQSERLFPPILSQTPPVYRCGDHSYVDAVAYCGHQLVINTLISVSIIEEKKQRSNFCYILIPTAFISVSNNVS